MVETQETSSKRTRAEPDSSTAANELDHESPSRSLKDLHRLLVWIVTLASAVGAAIVHVHPTGARFSDVVFALVFGALVALASSRAQPWAWVVASGVAAAASSGAWTLVACAALAIAVLDALVDLPLRRALGAVIGAVDVQVLLRMPSGRLALNALVVSVAAGCLVYSGRAAILPFVRRPSRRVWI